MQLDFFPSSPIQLSPALVARLKAARWVDPVRKCWCWTASIDSPGYASISASGRVQRVSRLAYKHWRGPIPQGLHVMHSCDNRICFNPDHLSVGTNRQNHADASRKGRKVQKLSRLQVAEIIASPLSQQALAERFGVSQAAIGHYRRRHAGAAFTPL